MKDDGSIINKIILNGEEEPVEVVASKPTLSMFEGVVTYAKQQQPSGKYKDTFSSKWEEIVKVAELNVNANRWRQANTL